MSTRVSKHFSNGRHDGWKKTVGGHEWFLEYGTSAGDEAKAKRLAAALEAKWQLVRLLGHTELSQHDFEEMKALVNGQVMASQTITSAVPSSASKPSTTGRQLVVITPTMISNQNSIPGLYEAIEVFAGTLKRRIKPDNSNADHMLNTCDRITRAKDGLTDRSLDQIRRKDLDDWLAFFGGRPPSRTTGKPIGPTTVRNIAQAIRMFLSQCIEWEWWVPPPLWERAFRPFSIKQLSTDAETRRPKTSANTYHRRKASALAARQALSKGNDGTGGLGGPYTDGNCHAAVR